MNLNFCHPTSATALPAACAREVAAAWPQPQALAWAPDKVNVRSSRPVWCQVARSIELRDDTLGEYDFRIKGREKIVL